MKFIYYDLIFLALFTVFIIFFLRKNRTKVKKEGIFFLYKTKFGIKFIDKFSERYKKPLKILSYVVITFGYLAMVAMIVLLVINAILLIKLPQSIAAKAPPVMPFLPYTPQLFKIPELPDFYFTQWLIIIIIIAITHEFAHGIFARLSNVKIKSTGFGFLGPIMLAFVEQDEKSMNRKKKKSQLSILAAGSFSNFVFGILFILLFLVFFNLSVHPVGILYESTAINATDFRAIHFDDNYFTKENISQIQNFSQDNLPNRFVLETTNNSYIISKSLLLSQLSLIEKPENQSIYVFYDSPAINASMKGKVLSINGLNVKDKLISSELKKIAPYQKVEITTTEKTYEMTAIPDPLNASHGFTGIAYSSTFDQNTTVAKIQRALSPVKNPFMGYGPRYNQGVYSFFTLIFFWLIIASIGMALFNMLPFAFLDGGRFFFLTILAITKSKKKTASIYKIANIVILLIFAIMVLIWLFRWISGI
ncbi:MAG: site-2 protease family protein [Candidatus Pacearchaeota archaeon]|nr:site-2 protease family protein [Candidatus Pacearchaeota archaeon]